MHFTNAIRKKNSYVHKKCRNGVPAFRKVVEHHSSAFRLNLSTVNEQRATKHKSDVCVMLCVYVFGPTVKHVSC